MTADVAVPTNEESISNFGTLPVSEEVGVNVMEVVTADVSQI
jgi:hypothetical protein